MLDDGLKTVTDNQDEKIVTIFGGSKVFGENSPEYIEAKELGGRLAEAGFTICTGGYLGIMEAASRGAREKGGRVLGIVMNQFKSRAQPLSYRQSCDRPLSTIAYRDLITRSHGFCGTSKAEWERSRRSRSCGIN